MNRWNRVLREEIKFETVVKTWSLSRNDPTTDRRRIGRATNWENRGVLTAIAVDRSESRERVIAEFDQNGSSTVTDIFFCE